MGCSIALAVLALLVPAFVVIQAHGLHGAAETYGAWWLALAVALWTVVIAWTIKRIQARPPYIEADIENLTVAMGGLSPGAKRLQMDRVDLLLHFVTHDNDIRNDLYAVCSDGSVLYLIGYPSMVTMRVLGYLFGKEILRVVSKESRALSIENLDSLQSYLKRGFTTDGMHWMARAVSTGAVPDMERLRSAGETVYDPETQEDSFRLDK